MSGTIWTKFYWSDWETDPALKMCSLAAQGLWMRMLCIAAVHEPIGYVAVKGIGLDIPAIANVTGASVEEVKLLIPELEKWSVFKRDRAGVIYSKRMVNDEKKQKIARKNGKNGGNPSLSKRTGNSASDNPRLKAPVKGGLKTHMPEARVQKESKKELVAGAAPSERRDTYSESDSAMFTRDEREYPY